MSRYKNREVARNQNELYEQHFENRGVSSIKQYRTPVLKYPTTEQSRLISYVTHVWALRDKFYILASKYYDDPKLWWIIAQYNQSPTEQHLTEGQEIKIPFPLGSVYGYLGQI